METENLMTIPLSEDKKENCWFIALLMANYSTFTKNLILSKRAGNEGSLINVIKKLVYDYYYYNTKTLNFFHIITPEILLLKTLDLMRREDLRTFIINTKHFELPMSFICDFHHSIGINCFKVMTIDNDNYYCEVNDYYDLKVVDDKLSFKSNGFDVNANDLKTSIITLLEDKPEMIIIQKEKETTEEAEILKSIINTGKDYEKSLNLNNYRKSKDNYKTYNDVIYVNDTRYRLDCCIIKSSVNNSYLLLLNVNEKKFIYDISNGLLNENNWTLNSFVYNDYSFQDSPSAIAIYINVD